MKIRKKIHDDWATPKELLDELKKEFGEMFDPCPLRMRFDDGKMRNGLEMNWAEVNFINPPYNRKDKEAFIEKAYSESRMGKICIMLLPVSTSTKIFHRLIYPHAEIRFIKGRVRFKGINSKGEYVENKCGMHDSMLVIFKK